MPLGLSDHQLRYFGDTFQLSYHLAYLDVCAKKIPLSGLDVLEVGGALPASLVIDHLHCNSWTGVEAPSYDHELGEANQFHRNNAEKSRVQNLVHKYRHIYNNVEELGKDHHCQYDLIFSIACFEHINRLPLAINKLFHCLKPGGKLFTMHSPIWSAFDGHHLPIKIPERFNKKSPQQSYIFAPWAHLLQSRSDTYRDITNRFDRQFAEEAITIHIIVII